ncbi:hypothetical protein SNEBB_000893 [Seison nebaliae]|nr:hypothetical protein SNEBB_000893 [Seison nebaliae]
MDTCVSNSCNSTIICSNNLSMAVDYNDTPSPTFSPETSGMKRRAFTVIPDSCLQEAKRRREVDDKNLVPSPDSLPSIESKLTEDHQSSNENGNDNSSSPNIIAEDSVNSIEYSMDEEDERKFDKEVNDENYHQSFMENNENNDDENDDKEKFYQIDEPRPMSLDPSIPLYNRKKLLSNFREETFENLLSITGKRFLPNNYKKSFHQPQILEADESSSFHDKHDVRIIENLLSELITDIDGMMEIENHTLITSSHLIQLTDQKVNQKNNRSRGKISGISSNSRNGSVSKKSNMKSTVASSSSSTNMSSPNQQQNTLLPPENIMYKYYRCGKQQHNLSLYDLTENLNDLLQKEQLLRIANLDDEMGSDCEELVNEDQETLDHPNSIKQSIPLYKTRPYCIHTCLNILPQQAFRHGENRLIGATQLNNPNWLQESSIYNASRNSLHSSKLMIDLQIENLENEIKSYKSPHQSRPKLFKSLSKNVRRFDRFISRQLSNRNVKGNCSSTSGMSTTVHLRTTQHPFENTSLIGENVSIPSSSSSSSSTLQQTFSEASRSTSSSLSSSSLVQQTKEENSSTT